MVNVLQIAAALETKKFAVAFHLVTADLLENYVFKADALRPLAQSVKIKAHQTGVGYFKVLYRPELALVIYKAHAAVVDFVDHEVELSSENVVKQPLVVVGVVVPKVQVTCICQVYNLVRAERVHIARLHVVVQEPIAWAVLLHVLLYFVSHKAVDQAQAKHLLLEAKVRTNSWENRLANAFILQ